MIKIKGVWEKQLAQKKNAIAWRPLKLGIPDCSLHPTSKLKINIFVNRLYMVLRDLLFRQNNPMTITLEFSKIK